MNHTLRHITTALVVTSLALVAGACSDDTKVGSSELETFESQSGEGALGNTTTTVAPAETTAPPATAAPTTAAPKPTTTAPPQTTAAPPTTVAASITVKIQGDAQGNAFEPSNVRAYQGSIVRFQNVDGAAHQIKARGGEFGSPSIPAGGTWDFKANLAPGVYEYTDLSRPYAVGYLEIIAR